MSEQTFLDHLKLSRLLDETQLDEVNRRCAAGTPVQDLPAVLVEKGWLTTYQVRRLVAGQPQGMVLGQYRILEEIGRGGFGCVYKAMHGIMNRVVAMKVISPEFIEDSRARTWFLREVLATTQLHHPNIVMAYDADEVDGALFLAMEYVEGLNLDQVVRLQGPLPIGLAFGVLYQAACALQCAHEKAMVHRDIKPANLLLPSNATPGPSAEAETPRATAGIAAPPLVKVVDFGLARLYGKNSPHTLQLKSDKGFVGTPAYISPEQARSVHTVDIRSDLYSLGCTLYFALTGVQPFRGESSMEILIQHLEKEAPSLSRLRPETPPALVSIVRRLMAKKPEQRFQTPMELVAELRFLTGSWLATSAPAAAVLAPAAEVNPLALTQPVQAPPISTMEPRTSPTGHRRQHSTSPVTPLVAEHVRKTHIGLTGPFGDAPPIPHERTAAAVADPTAPCERVPPETPNAAAKVDAAMRQRWTQWLALLEVAAEGGKPGVSDSAYRQLHAPLAKSIGGMANQVAGLETATWRHLETLVAPWLTLQTLTATDLATLNQLCQSCRQCGQQLHLGRGSGAVWGWKTIGVALMFGVCLGLLVAFRANVPVAVTWPSLAPAWRFLQASPLVVLVPPLILGALFLLPRLMHR